MTFKQGETVNIVVSMTESLTGATAELAYKKGEEDTVIIDCTIDDTDILAVLTPAVTSLMEGYYNYEVKVTDENGDIDIVKDGIMEVQPSIFIEEV